MKEISRRWHQDKGSQASMRANKSQLDDEKIYVIYVMVKLFMLTKHDQFTETCILIII